MSGPLSKVSVRWHRTIPRSRHSPNRRRLRHKSGSTYTIKMAALQTSAVLQVFTSAKPE